MRKLILLLTISTLISCTKNERVEISEPMKITASFFDNYKTDGPHAAIRKLLLTNKYISKQATDTVGRKLERLANDLGDFQGYELIAETYYGKGVAHLAYIVKYSAQPLRFKFKFYNPGNGWRVQNFGFESEFLDELDEVIKPHMLKENGI